MCYNKSVEFLQEKLVLLMETVGLTAPKVAAARLSKGRADSKFRGVTGQSRNPTQTDVKPEVLLV